MRLGLAAAAHEPILCHQGTATAAPPAARPTEGDVSGGLIAAALALDEGGSGGGGGIQRRGSHVPLAEGTLPRHCQPQVDAAAVEHVQAALQQHAIPARHQPEQHAHRVPPSADKQSALPRQPHAASAYRRRTQRCGCQEALRVTRISRMSCVRRLPASARLRMRVTHISSSAHLRAASVHVLCAPAVGHSFAPAFASRLPLHIQPGRWRMFPPPPPSGRPPPLSDFPLARPRRQRSGVLERRDSVQDVPRQHRRPPAARTRRGKQAEAEEEVDAGGVDERRRHAPAHRRISPRA